jgi:hypothetical protein
MVKRLVFEALSGSSTPTTAATLSEPVQPERKQQSKPPQPEKDWEAVPSEELRDSKARGAAEEKIRRSFTRSLTTTTTPLQSLIRSGLLITKLSGSCQGVMVNWLATG